MSRTEKKQPRRNETMLPAACCARLRWQPNYKLMAFLRSGDYHSLSRRATARLAAFCPTWTPKPAPGGLCSMAGEKRRKGSRKEKHKKRKRRRRSRSRSTDGSSGGSGRRRRAPSPRRLLLAAALGDKEQLRDLLKQGADVAYADAEGTTALHEVTLVCSGRHR